jgi:hypothetical protein
MTARAARQRWADAEQAYQTALHANPSNNRQVGSTYSGGPNGRRASRRTPKAPRSASARWPYQGAAKRRLADPTTRRTR